MEENKIEDINEIDEIQEIEENAIGAISEDGDGGSDAIPLEFESASKEAEYKVTKSDREEYNRLIKTKFKDIYSEDTQRLINRRFRKYRVLEEKYRVMEESLRAMEASVADSERKLSEMNERMAEENARVMKETEERVLSEIRARRSRPIENAISPRQSSVRPDVSRLTKSERERIAKRAANGEKIHF